MSERWARAVLSTYRWAGAASYPFVGGYVVWRASQGMEDRGRRHERYGKAALPRPDGPLIWVHAASDGETIAVVSLVEHFLSLGVWVVLTTHTVSSADTCRERLGDRVIHQYVPLDLKPALARFLDHWHPDLAIFAESEIWPMTILELKARRIPQVLVSARLSDRAFASWKKRSWIAEALFENFAMVVAQSDIDAERFLALGARPVSVGGNLRTDVSPLLVGELELRRVRNEIGARPLWTAFATCEGEEAVAGEVHALLKHRHPDILTVVVPRSRQRGDALEEQLTALGLNVSRRGRKDRITPKTHVLLGDTAGEAGLYLRLGDIVFLGNSLLKGGGENPLDAVMLGNAVLAGQNIGYYRDIYQPLIDRGGVRLVRDRDMLAGAVNFLMRNDKARAEIVAAGAAAVDAMRGAFARTVRNLEPFVQPLVVKARLETGAVRRRG
jgi:3-deoxy-D-manno-octulosonic-acid transferase